MIIIIYSCDEANYVILKKSLQNEGSIKIESNAQSDLYHNGISTFIK